MTESCRLAKCWKIAGSIRRGAHPTACGGLLAGRGTALELVRAPAVNETTVRMLEPLIC